MLQSPSQVLHLGPSACKEFNRNWVLTSSSHQLSQITRQYFHKKGNVITISYYPRQEFLAFKALFLEDSHLLFVGGAQIAVISSSCRHSQVKALCSRLLWADPSSTESSGFHSALGSEYPSKESLNQWALSAQVLEQMVLKIQPKKLSFPVGKEHSQSWDSHQALQASQLFSIFLILLVNILL